MTRLNHLVFALIAAASLTACGKPQDRPMISDAADYAPAASQQFVPAAEYKTADKVVRKRMRVSGCLYESDRGIVNLRLVIRIEKSGDNDLIFKSPFSNYVRVVDSFNNPQDREDAYVRAINGWSNCLNDYNATTVEELT